MSDNLVRLDKNTFLVRTQAGFRKAICLYTEVDSYSLFKAEFGYIEGYPKGYPSIVKFYSYYRGYTQIGCNCTKVNKYLDKLYQIIDMIKDSEKQSKSLKKKS